MTTASYDHAPAHTGDGIGAWIFTTDHKRVGILYLIGSVAAFLVAGLMAIGIRIGAVFAPASSASCSSLSATSASI